MKFTIKAKLGLAFGTRVRVAEDVSDCQPRSGTPSPGRSTAISHSSSTLN